MVGKIRRNIGIGGYPDVTLLQARERARLTRDMVRQGIDPVIERASKKQAIAAEQMKAFTFKDAFERWADAKIIGRPEKSQKAVRATIYRYAMPNLGSKRLNEIDTKDIVGTLQDVWLEKPETAQKLRGYLEGIFAWANVAGHREGENPARWAGNLKELLPPPSVTMKDKSGNFPALSLSDAPHWWRELQKRGSMGALALRFATLCASRSGEVRGALWSEIDLETAIWTIPASRMKARKEHRVPLSQEALAVLALTPRMSGCDLIFPNRKDGQLSDMTISKVMRDMQEAAEKMSKYPEKAGWRDQRSGRPAVPHGLRSTFRDWTAESGHDRDLAELALAHTVGSAVERAYRRTDMMDRRRNLMIQWAAFLNNAPSHI